MKVIVVGAGLMGLSSAYYLNQLGCEVTVLEKNAGVGLGTSFANAGIITPSLCRPWNAPGAWHEMFASFFNADSDLLFRPRALPSMMGWGLKFLTHSTPKKHWYSAQHNTLLAKYNLQLLNELSNQYHFSIEKGKGLLMIFRNPTALEEALQRAQEIADLGLHFEALSPKALCEKEPALAPIQSMIAGAIHFPMEQSGNAHRFCKQLANICEQNGVDFVFNQTVDTLSLQHDRIQCLQTQQSQYSGDAFVLTTGPLIPVFAKKLKLKIPIQPAKGYSISIPKNKFPVIPNHSVIDYDIHAALTPMDDIMRIAGTVEFTGYDLSLNPSRLKNLISLVNQVYPDAKIQLEQIGHYAPWAGLRPTTYDGLPIIGRTNVPNLYINAGHGHKGWTQAVGSGKLLADCLLGNPTEIDVQPFSYQRL